ncbi:MAG: MoxR family ATPase [Candidatus Heimdallarchaeota archaeon]|nr:MoxR family ATPase [Candidatus Heimdallarchaeota archaeon]
MLYSGASSTNIPKFTISQALKLLQIVISKINRTGKQGIFIWGSPGIGKSDLVKELALLTNRDFIDIRLSTLDPVDLRGLPSIDTQTNQTNWIPPNFLPTSENNPGILFLDEINAAPPSIQTAAYQLILDRKIGTYIVPENWIIIAAGNRLGDRSITFRLPTALSNRFTHLEIEVSTEEWYQWAWKNSIDPYIISFLRYQPELLNRFDPETEEMAFPTPRSWAFASSFEDVRSEDLVLYYKAIQGTVGEAVAQQFLAYLKYQDQIPDPDSILEGKNYETPKSPDMQYLLMSGLINELLSNFTHERIKQYFAYVSKFSKTEFVDYGVVLVKELLLAIESNTNLEQSKSILTDHNSFKNWVNDNIEVFT